MKGAWHEQRKSTVLLAPLQLSDDDETVRRKLEATATYLDTWLMRRVVHYVRFGYSSVSYTMFTLCRDIRRKPLPDLLSILQKRLAEDEVTFDGHKQKPQRKGLSDLRLNQFSRRYIYHLLARVTAFVEQGCGRSESFDKLVDRTAKNPFDIEHKLPDNYGAVSHDFESENDFEGFRNHIASLLLLPADVNRSLQDKPYTEMLVASFVHDLRSIMTHIFALVSQDLERFIEDRSKLGKDRAAANAAAFVVLDLWLRDTQDPADFDPG